MKCDLVGAAVWDRAADHGSGAYQFDQFDAFDALYTMCYFDHHNQHVFFPIDKIKFE